ncbi:helix-turn-helix domain-containing protein [Nocardiopsis alba]|uniref:helix-turn-helix domain-containing protein n=1 Tax=Nocardiopsis alba TaxID=53437 RepID=UPI00036F49B2|nr:helix-turn-helix domain-containing protein [Nocardiopsis alba]
MEAERSRGQHAGLDARTIRRAAVRLVGREGLSALSMRGLGAELGAKAMALYHHLPSKEALPGDGPRTPSSSANSSSRAPRRAWTPQASAWAALQR